MASESEKKIYKAAIVDANELVKANARDAGDARMTESKEDRSGNKLQLIVNRIWKHNLAQGWYRNQEIGRVKKDILKTGNIYAGEKDFDPDHPNSDAAGKEALREIIKRFTSEYEEEMLEAEERDSKEVLENESANVAIKDLVNQYARSAMTPQVFEEQKKRILSRYDKKYASKKNLYADNLLVIADEIRDKMHQEGRLAQFDFDIEVTLGKARETLSTQAHLTSFDTCVEKMQNSKLGRWIANEPAAMATTAALWELSRNALQKTVRSKAVQWGTFGLAAVAAGGISAVKERARITRERAQHQREEAKGMHFTEADMKRRQEMDENSYAVRKATAITENLRVDLARALEGNLSEAERNAMIGTIADLEARLQINRLHGIDLIVYDKFNVMERDRNTMRDTWGELKKTLRGDMSAEAFQDQIEDIIDVQKRQLLEGEGGIEEKDRVFKKLRNNRAWKAFRNTALISATVGTAVHEAKLLFDEVMMSPATIHPEDFADDPTHTNVYLPDGVNFRENADLTYDLVRDGHVIASHVPVHFDAQGHPLSDMNDALLKNGITWDATLSGGQTTETVHQSVHDYVRDHGESRGMEHVHRHTWFDDDSKTPIKNATKLEFGGINGTGIDEHGNYVFNVSHMTADGSYHHGLKIDAVKARQAGHEEMTFFFDRGSEHLAYKVPINAEGNAIIDPNSNLAKDMCETQNGHLVFHGYAEVDGNISTAADGGENISMLATYVGHPKEFIDTVVTKDTTVPNLLLHLPEETNVPLPFGIMGARRPLERGEYNTDATVQSGYYRAQPEAAPTPTPAPETLRTTTSTPAPGIPETPALDDAEKTKLKIINIAEKVGNEEALTEEEFNIYAQYIIDRLNGGDPTNPINDQEAYFHSENKEKFKALLAERAPAVSTIDAKATPEMQTVLDKFTTNDDAILLRYFIDKEDIIRNNRVEDLSNFYANYHDDNGVIKSPFMKDLVDTVAQIKTEGKEAHYEDATSKIVSYTNSVIKQLGFEANPETTEKTWAYSAIAVEKYNNEHSSEKQRKRYLLKDPFLWYEKKTKAGIMPLQRIADRQIGGDLLEYRNELKNKLAILKTDADEKTQKSIKTIENTIAKKDRNEEIGTVEKGELGRLMREIQTKKIGPIKLS